MPRKNIAILINSLSAGGAERVVANLLFSLRHEFDVHLLLLRNEIDYTVPEGQRIEFLSSEKKGGSEAGSNMIRLPMVAWRLWKYCSKNDIDLVLSFLPRPNFAAGLAKKFGLKSRVVMSERAYTPRSYDPATLRGRIGGVLLSWLYPYADAIVPNSQGTKDALIDVYGVSKNRYFVAENQIRSDEITEKCLEDVNDVDFTPFTFVCVAGFRRQKNHRFLIDAFGDLTDKNTQLVLIGKGRTLESVRSLVNSRGLNDRVRFLGQKENPHKYVARSQCFVLSSDYEGFPNVLLEALACGLPVISTDCLTGPRELLAPSTTDRIPANSFLKGEYGILVPVSDVAAMSLAMSEMINDPNLRKRYRSVAVRRALDFDQDTRPNPFRFVIDRVIEGRDFESL